MQFVPRIIESSPPTLDPDPDMETVLHVPSPAGKPVKLVWADPELEAENARRRAAIPQPPTLSFWRRLTRFLRRPDSKVWKSRAESRRELAQRNTVLGWRRAPRTDHILDPDSVEGVKAARAASEVKLTALALQMREVEDEKRMERRRERGDTSEFTPTKVTTSRQVHDSLLPE